jgi:hypothetical protein
MIRNIITGAAIAFAILCSQARAQDVLVTTLEPGGGEIAIAVAKIEAAAPHDDSTCYVWIGGRRLIVGMTYVQVLDLMAAESPAGRVIRAK